MATNIPVGGSDYPTAVGHRQRWVGDHVGPANYQQPGETVTPNMFGFPGFVESLGSSFGGYTQSNTYFVRARWPANNASSTTELAAPVFSSPTANNCLVLQWLIAANSAQVANNTNLAAEIVRLEAWGG
jgi:hypothetical protein